jgi:hypothetical protein
MGQFGGLGMEREEFFFVILRNEGSSAIEKSTVSMVKKILRSYP